MTFRFIVQQPQEFVDFGLKDCQFLLEIVSLEAEQV